MVPETLFRWVNDDGAYIHKQAGRRAGELENMCGSGKPALKRMMCTTSHWSELET